jgi:nickel/cobalt transporter (NiCoT) family protein
MQDMPTEWSALCALVFMLGLRHGFDADHLATIDGLTRFNQRRGRPFARYCGALFSLGHGAVVVVVAIAVALVRDAWATPAWLELAGSWIAISFLLLVGVLNLRAVLAAGPGEIVAPAGFKGRFLGRLATAGQPLTIALVGSIFAVSFDTVSQTALFSLTAMQFGGVGHALALALLFGGGMIVTDAINGWWISRLIARADEVAVIASRVMGLAVASMSLLIAGLGIGGLAMPALARWSEQRGLGISAFVCLTMLLGYACARWMTREACRRPTGR